MPKRIMSIKNSIINDKPIKESVKKVPKDRSALVGIKRTRKSKDQIYVLQRFFDDGSKKPSKAELKKLANDTGLKL